MPGTAYAEVWFSEDVSELIRARHAGSCVYVFHNVVDQLDIGATHWLQVGILQCLMDL